MTIPLGERRCTPCRPESTPLDAAAIAAFGRETPAWALSADATRITRRFTFPDFDTAFGLVLRVADIARAEDHHPDIAVGWGYAEFTLATHAIGGLSENDFILAARIDAAAS